MWHHRSATIYCGGSEIRSVTNRNMAQKKLWGVARPSIKTETWTAVTHLPVTDYDLEKERELLHSLPSCTHPMLFHPLQGYCGKNEYCTEPHLTTWCDTHSKCVKSLEEQCLTEKDDVKCEISEAEKSIFVPNISQLQQPTQQAYACLCVSKTIEKKGFHC